MKDTQGDERAWQRLETRIYLESNVFLGWPSPLCCRLGQSSDRANGPTPTCYLKVVWKEIICQFIKIATVELTRLANENSNERSRAMAEWLFVEYFPTKSRLPFQLHSNHQEGVAEFEHGRLSQSTGTMSFVNLFLKVLTSVTRTGYGCIIVENPIGKATITGIWMVHESWPVDGP